MTPTKPLVIIWIIYVYWHLGLLFSLTSQTMVTSRFADRTVTFAFKLATKVRFAY